MDDYEHFKQRLAALSGAIFLFGLAVLFLMDAIFPAILPLIWIALIPVLIAEQGWKYGLWILAQVGIWLGGLPLLLELGQVFPGVLILGGLSTLLVAIAPPDKLDKEHQAWVRELREGRVQDKRKRKREWGVMPLPPDADDDLPDEAFDEEEHYSARAGRK